MRTIWLILVSILIAHTCRSQNTVQPRHLPIAEEAIATIKLEGFPDFLAAADSTAWVTNQSRVDKLILGHSTPVASIRMPSPCGAMAVDFSALWVANCSERSLYRIDSRSDTITAVIHTGLADPDGELSVATGAGSVWLLTDSIGILSRIDPRTNEIVQQIRVKPYSYAAAFGFDAVWITNTGKGKAKSLGSVQRIDPKTNRVVATIPVGPVPRFLAVGAGGVWVLNQGDGTVTRVDPVSNSVVATIPVGVPGGGGDIAAGANRVWVRATKVLLTVIDPTTNKVELRYGPPMGSGAVKVANDIVWVSAHDVNSIWVLRK